MSKTVSPTVRAILEGLAVLAGILLAFGLQAAWEVRSDRQTATALLQALQVEWEGEQAKLDETLALIQSNRRAIVAMADAHLNGAQGISADSAAALYRAMAWRTYRPALGAVNSLLLTDLDNVGPAELRSAIAAWPGVLEQGAPGTRALQEVGLLTFRHDVARVAQGLELPWVVEGEAVNELFGVEYPRLALAVIADTEFIVRLRHVHSVLHTYEQYVSEARAVLVANLLLLNASLEGAT